MFHSLSQRTIRKPVQIGLFFITALLMVLRFSYSTSFLYPECYAYDSAIFQIVGKYWAEGVIPYQQLFDHKGPLIFFINAIGYRIYPHYGLIPLQVISLTLTLFLFFVRQGFGCLVLVHCSALGFPCFTLRAPLPKAT